MVGIDLESLVDTRRGRLSECAGSLAVRVGYRPVDHPIEPKPSSRPTLSQVHRRYASITGATRDTSSSLFAEATASAFTTWRSIAMPIS
jgi:hypothetical protein